MKERGKNTDMQQHPKGPQDSAVGGMNNIDHGGDALEPALSDTERTQLLHDYRDAIQKSEAYLSIPFRGLTTYQVSQTTLDQMYVGLQVASAVTHRSEHAIAPQTIDDDDKKAGLIKAIVESLFTRSSPEQDRGSGATDSLIMQPEAALLTYHRLVFFGGVGAGKSTLLRHIALHAAREGDWPVPILVRLREHDNDPNQSSLSDFALQMASSIEGWSKEKRQRLRKALQEEIDRDRVLFLFDGLDETSERRSHIGRRIYDLSSHTKCWIAVTSRYPIGAARISELAHFQLCWPFCTSVQNLIEQPTHRLDP